jgi:hypothetical protein
LHSPKEFHTHILHFARQDALLRAHHPNLISFLIYISVALFLPHRVGVLHLLSLSPWWLAPPSSLTSVPCTTSLFVGAGHWCQDMSIVAAVGGVGALHHLLPQSELCLWEDQALLQHYPLPAPPPTQWIWLSGGGGGGGNIYVPWHTAYWHIIVLWLVT